MKRVDKTIKFLDDNKIREYSNEIDILNGKITTLNVTIINSRSVAEDVVFYKDQGINGLQHYTGKLSVTRGDIDDADITSAYQITNPSANVALTIAATNTRLLVAPTSDPAPVSFFTDVTLPNTVQDGRMLTISSNVQIQFLRTISPWVSTVTRLGNVALGANTEVKLMFVGGGTGASIAVEIPSTAASTNTCHN